MSPTYNAVSELLSVHIVTVSCCIQAEELGNKARELKGLIDDSESVIFINLDRYAHTHNKYIQYVFIQYVANYKEFRRNSHFLIFKLNIQ